MMMEKAAAAVIDIFLARREPPDASFFEMYGGSHRTRSSSIRDLFYYVPEAREALYRARLEYNAERRAEQKDQQQ